MKSVLAFAVTAGALWAASMTPSQADPYKWCAIYGGNAIDGSKGCWFVTHEQCQATVTGLAGFCVPNTFSTEPAAPSVHARREKKRAS